MSITQSASSNQTEPLVLAQGTSCIVLGGSSITTISKDGEAVKLPFYPTTVQEYVRGIVDSGLEGGRITPDQPGVLIVAAPGAFQNEGMTASLPPSFHRVKDDAVQRGMPNFFFNRLIEEELDRHGYGKVRVFGYNDAVPALTAILNQENTEDVLRQFETGNPNLSRDSYALKYLINGTGTGEATIYPDTQKVITAEKGHLKPNYLWYQLNPFFRAATKLPIVGQNRSIERLIAGGPNNREPRHFTKILNAVLDTFKNPNGNINLAEEMANTLGFANLEELKSADGSQGILSITIDTQGASSLKQLGEAMCKGSHLAMAIRNILARALGTSMAHLHYYIGEMPDSPLNTFIGSNEVRPSFLGFTRSDGSTTALIGSDQSAWRILNAGAYDYASSFLPGLSPRVQVLNINEVFPHIHPDFGGLPYLAEHKLNVILNSRL